VKTASIGDFLTDAEIARATELWAALKDTGTFAATLAREVIEPVLPRINAALGQENDSRYLAYMVEYVFGEADRQQAGHLWEWAEDRCKVCNAQIGAGLRFMHLGLCETCQAAPKH
jgi:hypothetical protein